MIKKIKRLYKMFEIRLFEQKIKNNILSPYLFITPIIAIVSSPYIILTYISERSYHLHTITNILYGIIMMLILKLFVIYLILSILF